MSAFVDRMKAMGGTLQIGDIVDVTG